MTAARLSATEAVLSLAAAQSGAEVHASRLALIESGPAMLRPLDTSDLVAGDGSAGHTLLAGPPRHVAEHMWPVARRVNRLTGRFVQLRGDTATPTVQPSSPRIPDVMFSLVDDPDLDYVGGGPL